MEILIYILIAIGMIEIILAFCANWNSEKASSATFGSGITLIIVSIICIIVLLTEETKIEPIEVYRGNTVLQITYQDSIPIDSVVVYKNK